MAWIVMVRELAEEGQPTGRFRLTATSDEDGGGPWGDESHSHPSREEAGNCADCIAYCDRVTGIPTLPPAHAATVSAHPAPDLWFVWEPVEASFMTFKTEAAALEVAREALAFYRAEAADQGRWMEEVDGLLVGRVTHVCAEIKVTPAEDDDPADYYCDYELRPVVGASAPSDGVDIIPTFKAADSAPEGGPPLTGPRPGHA